MVTSVLDSPRSPPRPSRPQTIPRAAAAPAKAGSDRALTGTGTGTGTSTSTSTSTTVYTLVCRTHHNGWLSAGRNHGLSPSCGCPGEDPGELLRRGAYQP